jgi:alpha-tubulin suppressor-like RCC1 family protein
VLKNDGSIACWGRNNYGQSTPPAGNDFTQIWAGHYYNCALKNDGSIACWGKHYAQGTFLGNDITQVSIGSSHFCALKNDGSIACWGSNYFGQRNSPNGNDFIQVNAGNSHNCALRNNGKIVCWGRNSHGQRIPPGGNNFIQVSASESSNSCALKNDGSIVCWGAGWDTPLAGNDFIEVSVGSSTSHGCALKNDGSIACWGNNDYGQSTPPTGNDFIEISTTGYHSCALKNDGSIICWGDNRNGQIIPPTGNDFVGSEMPDDNDGDGVPDEIDNCPTVANTDQTDADNDGIGDVCDPFTDSDEDGIADSNDNCPAVANPDQTDTDGDDIGDVCDNDNDDGICIAPLGIDDADSCYQYKTQAWCSTNEGTWHPGLSCKTDFPMTPLLVTIDSFSATRNGSGKVKIKLVTGSETETAALHIYRAPAILQNLQQIQEVCQWDAVGTEVSGSVYSCKDENAPASVVYWPAEVENNGVTNNYLEFMTTVQ